MVKMKLCVYKKIMETLGVYPPERGGVLAIQNGIITDYYFDNEAEINSSIYIYKPSKQIGTVVDQWKAEGKGFGGLIHSHPGAGIQLSSWDIRFAKQLIERNHLDGVFMPIFNRNEIYFYYIDLEGNVIPMKYVIID